MYPLPQGRGQRQHGHLYHIVASREIIDPAQRFRVDHVLRIVRHQHVEAHAVPLLVRQHPLIDPVQAVALGCGTVVRAQRQVYARKLAGGVPHGGCRFPIVGVRAHEELRSMIQRGWDVSLQHAPDHALLMP